MDSSSIRLLGDLTRVETAAAEIRRRVRRGEIRPGDVISVRDLADRFMVRASELRSCLDSTLDADLLTVSNDAIVVASLDLRTLRSAMDMLSKVVANLIPRAPKLITATQLQQLTTFVASIPGNHKRDPDFYDSGQQFIHRLIGVAGTRHEQEFYRHAIDTVSRYEFLGVAVLAQAEGNRALSAAERGQLRLASCQELLDLCAAQAPEAVASHLRHYHRWATETAELSFHAEGVAVRRTLCAVR